MQQMIAGSLKITPTIAWTTSMLAWGMLNFGEGYNKSDMWATGMQTLKWNTDYLLKTILDDPTDSATSEAEEFYIVYQVSVVGGKLGTQLLCIAGSHIPGCLCCCHLSGYASYYDPTVCCVSLWWCDIETGLTLLLVLQVGNETVEKATWTRPEDETTDRPAYYMTTYNGTSDLAGQISAAFTSTAMVFQDSDPVYYATLMNYSTLVYAAGARNRAAYTSQFIYPCAADVDSTDVITTGTPECLPGDELYEGAMLATYNSTSYLDDLTWAAAWLNMATGDSAYLDDAYRYTPLCLCLSPFALPSLHTLTAKSAYTDRAIVQLPDTWL